MAYGVIIIIISDKKPEAKNQKLESEPEPKTRTRTSSEYGQTKGPPGDQESTAYMGWDTEE